MLHFAILHYTTRHYTTLHYTTLHYTTLHYTTLHYTILYYTILYYTILYYTILYYTILYYTILYYTILYYTILYGGRGHLHHHTGGGGGGRGIVHVDLHIYSTAQLQAIYANMAMMSSGSGGRLLPTHLGQPEQPRVGLGHLLRTGCEVCGRWAILPPPGRRAEASQLSASCAWPGPCCSAW